MQNLIILRTRKYPPLTISPQLTLFVSFIHAHRRRHSFWILENLMPTVGRMSTITRFYSKNLFNLLKFSRGFIDRQYSFPRLSPSAIEMAKCRDHLSDLLIWLVRLTPPLPIRSHEFNSDFSTMPRITILCQRFVQNIHNKLRYNLAFSW